MASPMLGGGNDHWPALRMLLAAHRLPEPEREYHFAFPRRYRADFAWPTRRLLLEVQGGAFVNGRHTRGAGYLRDMERHNDAVARGWRVLYCTPRDVRNGKVLTWLRPMLVGGL